jgi:DNA-binding SARP family transcriptional activator
MGPQIDTSPVGAPAQPANSGSQTTSASELTELTNALSKYVGLGEWAEAVRILQSLISLDPTNTHYYLRLGDYSLKAGNQAEAIRCYYEAADLYFKSGFSVKAIGTYNMILKIAPGETLAPMLMKLAEAQKQQVMKDEPQHSETLKRCLHSYHEVTTLGSGNESRVLDRLT